MFTDAVRFHFAAFFATCDGVTGAEHYVIQQRFDTLIALGLSDLPRCERFYSDGGITIHRWISLVVVGRYLFNWYHVMGCDPLTNVSKLFELI
jgi:hypothetical protein